MTRGDAARPRLPLLSPESLDPELRLMLDRWQAEGGDPNFILTLARLPETLKRFVAFYSPLVRKGAVEHRTKELARLRLAQLNGCAY